jgi:hypothetical protein
MGVVGLEAEEGLEVEELLEVVEIDADESVRLIGTRSCSEIVVVVILEVVRERHSSWPSCGVGSVGCSLEIEPYLGIQLSRRLGF